MCLGGCGFYANPELSGFCSKCFEKQPARALPGDEFWIPACYGAALGDVTPVQNYITVGGTADRCVTKAESRMIAQGGVFVESGATLLEIAVARDSNDVISLLTDDMLTDDKGGSDLIRHQMSSLMEDLPKTKSFKDKFGELDGPALPDEVRATMVSLQRERPDGLTYLELPSTPCAQSLFMPAEIAAVDPGLTGPALGLLIEAKDCLAALETTIGWWHAHGAAQMVPLYTSADLNCLLHACSLTLAGVRDSMRLPDCDGRCFLRDLLYRALSKSERLREAVSNPRFSSGTETETGPARLEEVLSRACKDRVTLDGAHIFAMANVLRRPIICHAPPDIEGREVRHTLAVPFRMSGIYLPLMWEPASTSPDPLVVAYTQGKLIGALCVCWVAPVANTGGLG